MNLKLKRMRELARYTVTVTKEQGFGAMLRRAAGFVKRRFFGKKARYLPAKKVLEAQRAGKRPMEAGEILRGLTLPARLD